MTDQEVINGIKKGGRALEEVATFLVKKSQWPDDLTKHVRSKGGDKDLARQIYIDAYISFQENILADRFQGKSSLKTYFLSIASNKLIDHFRRAAKNTRTIATDPLEMDTNGHESENSEVLKVILPQVMRQMGDRCKTLLAFIALGYKHKEIAEVIGFSSDSVAANEVKKCRDTLRAHINQMIQAK